VLFGLVIGFELVLVLVLVHGVGFVQVLVKVVRFRTDGIEIVPPNQSRQQSVDPAGRVSSCAPTGGVAFSSCSRDIDRSGCFATFPAGNCVDPLPVCVAQTPNSLSDVEADAL